MHGALCHKARLALRADGGWPRGQRGPGDNRTDGKNGGEWHLKTTSTSETTVSSETTTPAESPKTTLVVATTTTRTTSSSASSPSTASPTPKTTATTTESKTPTDTPNTAKTTSAAQPDTDGGSSSTASTGSTEPGRSTDTGTSSPQTTATDLTGTGTTSANTAAASAAASKIANGDTPSSATSSAAASLSSSTSGVTKSSSHSNAGVIAGVVVAVAVLAIIGFLLYRFRRSPAMQRALAPLRKGRRDSSDIGPYYHMEKDDGTAPNMTGETLVGTSTMRAAGPVKAAAAPTANPNNLTVDTNHLKGRSVCSVSPISSQSHGAASDVSPVSPDPTVFPLQQPSPISNPEPGTAISIAGSEARIVSIPARPLRLSGSSSGGSGAGAGPAGSRPPPMRGPPSSRAAAVPGGTRYPGWENSARRPSRPVTGDRGGPYRRPAQWTDRPEDLRPPPLSINKYSTMMASHAPVAELNGGYKAYRPMMSSGNPAAVRSLTQNRVSHASTAASSLASSDVLSPDAWPMPPSTPRTSPDFH